VLFWLKLFFRYVWLNGWVCSQRHFCCCSCLKNFGFFVCITSNQSGSEQQKVVHLKLLSRGVGQGG
jgi:hypothetical protein